MPLIHLEISVVPVSTRVSALTFARYYPIRTTLMSELASSVRKYASKPRDGDLPQRVPAVISSQPKNSKRSMRQPWANSARLGAITELPCRTPRKECLQCLFCCRFVGRQRSHYHRTQCEHASPVIGLRGKIGAVIPGKIARMPGRTVCGPEIIPILEQRLDIQLIQLLRAYQIVDN